MSRAQASTAALFSLRLLWIGLNRRRRRQLLLLQLLSLLAALGEVANLGALLPFLKLLADPQASLSRLGPLASLLRSLSHHSLLLSLGLGFIVVVMLSSLLRVLTTLFQLRLGALIAADLGEKVLTAVLHRPYPWHLQHNSSETLGLLSKDVDQVYASIQAWLVITINLVVVMLLGACLLALAPGVMLVMASLIIGFYLLVFRFTRGMLRKDGQILTRNYQASLQVAQEGLGGIRDVLLNRNQAYFLQAFQAFNLRYRMAVAAINSKAQIPRFLIEGFAMILIVALSLVLALNGTDIKQQLPLVGTLVLGAHRLLQPLQQCFASLGQLQSHRASLQRLEPFLQPDASPAILTPTLAGCELSPGKNVPLVELQQVSFRYSETGHWILRDLNLCIQAGERLAFVGTTGCGKSTCSDLILGLLKPSLGTVFVQGMDLHATPRRVADWQQRVAHVPQHIYLSDASFACNIAFGIPSEQIDHQRLKRAAQQACIAELIESSPHGYETVVGERGVRLSGGQRQRIGIARALYKQAELLIFDEATSALDQRTEADVMRAIESLEHHLTVILIAHRLTTIRSCDRIVVVQKGAVAAVGNFADLAAHSLLFRSLSRS